MVEHANKEFKNVYVVINSANSMELVWLNKYENIKAALWCPGAGQTGFNAFGKTKALKPGQSQTLKISFKMELRFRI